METARYVLELSACLTIFAIIYHVFLRHLTFFSLSRFYLIGSLALSFCIPLIQINVEETIVSNSPYLPAEIRTSDLRETPELSQKNTLISTIQWETIIAGIYLLVAGALLLRFLRQTFLICKKVQANHEIHQNLILTPPLKGLINCSFFNVIFIDKEKLTAYEFDQILNHEREHIRRYHSADKLVLEILSILMWFNPLVYYYKQTLTLIHEFEVDAALACRISKKDYAGLLLRFSNKGSISLASSFSKSQLEIRVNMLFTKPSRKMKKVFYLALIPAAAVLGLYFSVQVVYAKVFIGDKPQQRVANEIVKEEASALVPTNDPVPASPAAVRELEQAILIPEKIVIAAAPAVKLSQSVSRELNDEIAIPLDLNPEVKTVVLDPGHGGKDNGSSAGSILEKDITLQAAKEIRKVLESRGFKVILTREADLALPLNKRAAIEGDVFISLHANNIPSGDNKKRGMEVFLGSNMDKSTELLGQSTRLAQLVHNELRGVEGIALNGIIIQTSLTVLRENVSPAIVVELGYMNDPGDLKFMTSKASQSKIGHALADALAGL